MVVKKQLIKDENFRRKHQYLATFIVSFSAMSVGSSLAWTSPALSYLSAKDSPLPITPNEASWIGSLVAIGALCSAIPLGICSDKYGRRNVAIGLTTGLIISWILIALAPSISIVLFARFLTGLSIGGIGSSANMYLMEVVEKEIKHPLMSCFHISITFGMLLPTVATMYFKYLGLTLMSALVSIIFLVGIINLPETPVQLLREGKRNESEQVIRWYRGRNCKVNAVVEEIKQSLEMKSKISSSKKSIFSSVATTNALLVNLSLMIFQHLSGRNAVIFYTSQIFESTGMTMDPKIASFWVMISTVPCAIITSFMMNYINRKTLLILSSTVSGVCLGGLGYYFRQKELQMDVSAINWLPLVLLITFIIGHSLGLGSIPWMLIGELYPPEIQGTSSGIIVTCHWIFVFIVTKMFGSLIMLLGTAFTFYLFMFCCILCVVYVIFKVPETKGRSLQDIHYELEGKHKKD